MGVTCKSLKRENSAQDGAVLPCLVFRWSSSTLFCFSWAPFLTSKFTSLVCQRGTHIISYRGELREGTLQNPGGHKSWNFSNRALRDLPAGCGGTAVMLCAAMAWAVSPQRGREPRAPCQAACQPLLPPSTLQQVALGASLISKTSFLF